MQDVRSRLADEAKSFGIELIDIRIKRVDFVADITDSVYRRMQSERQQVANELRSQGAPTVSASVPMPTASAK